MDFLVGDYDSDDGNVLKINTDYAKRYDKWRKSEELQKLKDKYGDNVEDETSSTSEEEDEDAVELTEEIEKDFFKTMSCLKEKNPKIYDDNVRFFKEKSDNEEVKKTKEKKKKPEETLTMAAYQRKLLLETNGIIEEEDESPDIEKMPLVEQEKALKESFRAALQESDSDGDEDGIGGLLKTKQRSKQEQEQEEKDYRQWLAGQAADIPQGDEEQLKGLRDYWTDPKLDDGEKFLRDYILNHRYLEKGGDPDEHAHVFSDSEEDTIEQQEEFERKFNFRFEEPDQEFMKRYPRTVEQSMRRKDDRRKRHREEVKARKLAERAQKDEELKRLKALKRAEIMEKISKLQKVTGNDDITFQDADVDGEFDPEKHDQRMAQLFNEEYYQANPDEEKPEFPDLDEELDIEKWDEWSGRKEGEEQAESADYEDQDTEFIMDCDYDPKSETQRELRESSRRRKKRRQSKFAEAASRPKPVFDPKDSKFERYLDEYYGLNYEDLIGDIPCRFKYRKTVPNDFGLSIEEILSAPDKELNRWVSVKKMMQRRPDHVEEYDVKAYRRKAANFAKKVQCLPTIYAPPQENEEEVVGDITNGAVSETFPAAVQKMKNVQVPERLRSSQPEASTGQHQTENTVVDQTSAGSEKISKTTKREENRGNVAAESSVSKTTSKKKKKRNRSIPNVPSEGPPKKKLKENLEDTLNNTPVVVGSKNPAGVSGKTSVVSKTPVADASSSKQQQKKKKRKKNKGNKQNEIKNQKTVQKPKKWKETKIQGGGVKSDPVTALSDGRLKSYGLNPKKFKNKMKYAKK